MLRPVGPSAGRRATGAVPVLLAGIVVAAVVLVISPAARHQLTLSTSRSADPYLEMSFVDETAARACTTDGAEQSISIRLRSHLDDAASVPYLIEVSSADRVVDRLGGAAATEPGEAADVVQRVRVPTTGAYEVTASLPGRPERLALHCGEPDGSGS